MKEMLITNARLHNLKNIDIKIPKDQFVVVTGVSGSGKSTLAFDLIFEEGRKAYLRSIGVLAAVDEVRSFDDFQGISPTVAVQQRIIRESNPRSVVGTKTRIYNYLRLFLMADGMMECLVCGEQIKNGTQCNCGYQHDRIDQSYFSFNSPRGMCLRCKGRGEMVDINLTKMLPDLEETVKDICKRLKVPTSMLKEQLPKLAKQFSYDLNTPYCELSEQAAQAFLYGYQYDELESFRGVIPFLRWKIFKKRPVGEIVDTVVCPACQGYKVGEEGLSVKLGGYHIGELGQMTVVELKDFLGEMTTQDHLSKYGQNLLRLIIHKLENMIDVGLGHLTLNREMPTLSGGEIQRLFLMTHLDSEMELLTYIFDEPTTGLHELEKGQLLDKLMALQQMGNSVIVVEHDPNTIQRADHIIDFGPLAGKNGGEVVYQGDYSGLLESEVSLTGKYLSERLTLPMKKPKEYCTIDSETKWIRLSKISTNNLKEVELQIPLGKMVGVAGVSGSGKSSLIGRTLLPLLQKNFSKKTQGVEYIEGVQWISGFAEISQSPIGRNSRSIPMTYLDIWSRVRELFAGQTKALELGLTAGDFSFNSTGACMVCQGIGLVTHDLIQLGTVTNICPECKGQRFRDEILEVTYRGKNIAEILQMSVEEGAELFQDLEGVRSVLALVNRIGMGYLTLGQPTPTLSGGEAQRLKLARELGKKQQGNILYILDEPTTGLSFHDIRRLLELLGELVDQGNSVIVVEHDPSVLAYCDWVIELGPGGGAAGGLIIAEGNPLDLCKNVISRIGPFLPVVDKKLLPLSVRERNREFHGDNVVVNGLVGLVQN